MNYAIFLGILNLILLSRLRLVLRDERISRKDMFILGGIPLLALPFLTFNLSWIILLIYLVAYPLLMRRIEKSTGNLNRNRVLILATHFLMVGVLCSPVVNLMLCPSCLLRSLIG